MRVKGKADILRLDSATGDRFFLAAEKRAKLLCSDVVVTRAKSRAKLKLKKGTVALGPNARLEIQNYLYELTRDASYLSLVYGKMRAAVKKDEKKKEKKKLDDQTVFRVRTPTAVAGVRGTDFYVSYDPRKKVMSQVTLEGAVEVKNEKTGDSQKVEAGTELIIREEKPAEKREIQPTSVADIRSISDLVREDTQFISKQAVQVLGAPEKWQAPEYTLPEDLKDLESDF